LINVGNSAFSSTNIIVDVRDIVSIVSLGGDDLGEENKDGNVLAINRYFCVAEGKWIEEPRALSLPGDAFRDTAFIDWIISDKRDESELANDFQDLMMKKHEAAISNGKIGAFDVLAARDQIATL
jgi:hypothetical protein